jgi:hypothetical protein
MLMTLQGVYEKSLSRRPANASDPTVRIAAAHAADARVVGAMWGFLVTALIALLLASLLRPLCESVPTRAEASR